MPPHLNTTKGGIVFSEALFSGTQQLKSFSTDSTTL
jgi:hypothetical protein